MQALLLLLLLMHQRVALQVLALLYVAHGSDIIRYVSGSFRLRALLPPDGAGR